MEWIVTTGKTVAEAVEAALDELGVDEADIEYEVVEEAKRGFLSRLGGGSAAKIRARVKPLSREKPDRRRRSGGGLDGWSGASGGAWEDLFLASDGRGPIQFERHRTKSSRHQLHALQFPRVPQVQLSASISGDAPVAAADGGPTELTITRRVGRHGHSTVAGDVDP